MSRFDAVTCLGCGCSCDDIAITIEAGRIVTAEHACTLGLRWFGDGTTPTTARIGRSGVDVAGALTEVRARLARLAGTGRCLIYLAPDVSVAGQQSAVALADATHSRLDSVSSDSIAAGILAAQRRGRSSATLGELRERVDLALYWGIDPALRYPRFVERYLPRDGCRVIAIDIGDSRGPAEAHERLSIAAEEEIDVLSIVRAASAGRGPDRPQGVFARASEIALALAAAKYVAVIYDAEPGEQPRDPARAEGLTALAQGLNTPTRAALCALRAGGNRMGADQVMSWQTGFPMSVDLSSGAPRYQPDRPASALTTSGEIELLVVVGDYRGVPAAVTEGLTAEQIVVIGPGASTTAPAQSIAIDTGRAGIHEGGVAFRMDDVPLPLTAPLPGPLTVADALAQLVAVRTGRP